MVFQVRIVIQDLHDKNSDDAFGIYISGEINDLFACRCWLGLKQIVWQSGTIWI